MKKKVFTILALVWSVIVMANDIPLVYNVENTGADCALPSLPTVDELPSVVRLPNPFEWSDGSGKIASFDDWKCRRNEIKTEIGHYEIGMKPDRPEDISATYNDVDSILTVTINENGKTVTLVSKVVLPEGTGPFPVVIGMNSPTGSLSSTHFANCIQIPFRHNDVATYSMSSTKDLEAPFYQMYPELSNAGDYCAWSWGISRLIDGIEMVKDQLNANIERIAVTGCSYAGKMALFAGAFDERIALTIAQESGGGGVNSWRVSETIGAVEKISNTSYTWFMPDLRDNFNGRVERLPYDHHELIAMIAPRAFLSLGNPDYTWLGDESGYVSLMAAREVWKYMGVEDRFGFDISKDHMHCWACDSQNEAVASFVNKFLHDDDSEDTSILTHPYQDVNYQFWISDWADVIEPDVEMEQYWYEGESVSCATIGSDLLVLDDTNASNGKYVTAKEGLNSMESAPGEEGLITIPVIINNHRNFNIYFRVNCANENEDSFWVQIDEGAFVTYDGLNTDGEWKWVRIMNTPLLAGNHTIKIGYRENGAKLDRIYYSNDLNDIPEGMGGEETECAVVPKCTILDFESGNLDGWVKQNPGAGIDITQEDRHSGEYALKMVNGGGTSAWSVQAFSPEIEIVPGHTYNVTFWIRAVDGDGKGRISTTGGGQLGGQYWADFTVGDEWQQIVYENLTAEGNSVGLSFDIGYIANKTYYIDDIVFEDITADPEPVAKMDKNSWDAGKIAINESAQSEVFSIRNIGTGILEITDISELPAPWSTTLEKGISLKAGQVQEFTFTFAPVSIGDVQADFMIKTNLEPDGVIIELKGEGTKGTGITQLGNPDVKVFSDVKGKVGISAPENSEVKITDTVGRTIGTYTVLSSILEISLRPGIYIVSVGNEKNYTAKVIVK